MESKDPEIQSSATVKISEQKNINKESDENSSNDSLIEIRLNECIKRSEVSDFDLRALVVRCSSCGCQISHYSNQECRRHRKLGVITCKECYDFYGSSEFSQDESGYNYCTWCGNGGKLTICDYCPNGFCNSCIRRNFGRKEISVTARENWKCYCCNKKRLKPKVKFCNLIMDSGENAIEKEKKVQTDANKNISEHWLQAAFNESDEACKKFHRKMSKLKTISVIKSKSLKHIVKKMEEVINNHKTELRNVVTSMTKQYEAYIAMQVQLNEKKTDLDCFVIDEDTSKDLSVGELSDASVSVLSIQDNNNRFKKKKAKLPLLKSSSEIEGANKVEPTNESALFDTDSRCNGQSSVKNDKNEDSDSLGNKNSHEASSPAVNPDDGSKSKVKAKCKLDFDGTSESDEDKMTNKKEDEEYKEIDADQDSKLKLEPRVNLICCDHLLKDGETYIKINGDTNVEDQLDKLVDSLCKFPLRKRKPEPMKKQKCGSLSSKKAAAKNELSESSSISLSSAEDEDQEKILPGPKSAMNAAISPAKKVLNSDNSSDLSLSSDDDDEKENVSSDGFVPVNRKRKYDKLHRPLFSDEEKPKKRRGLRKRRLLSSDDKTGNEKSEKSYSSASSDEEKLEKIKQPKKRRRIKEIASSSDQEEGDGEIEGQNNSPAKGRKNIRKIVSQKKLAKSTKEAQLEEKERRKRIFERQKLYSKIEDMSENGKEIITRKMVLEIDHDSKEEIVEIHPGLVCKLKPHQVDGVKFMWECTIETVKDLNKPGSGCILAHCMGLGKTLQVIAFLHTCLTNHVVNKVITRAMIICPYNTALNWASEFGYWLQDVEGDVTVHQFTGVKTISERMDILKLWFVDGGVLIISYDIFRRLSADKIQKVKAREKRKIHKYLLDPGPDIVVCDEGHILKNDKSAISVATNKLATSRRIVLTGTPLQNNLKEYHCMVSFVKPNLLGTAKEFRNRFVNPILNGQYDDSSHHDVKLMKERIHILHKLLEGCVQRCDYSALTKFLPPKHEFVISVKLSDIQIKMYKCYLERRMIAQKDVKAIGKTLFIDFNNLRCIWTHPYIFHVNHQRAEYKKLFKDDEDDDFVNDESPDTSESSSTTSDEDKLLQKIENDKKKNYRTRSRAAEDDDNEIEVIEDEVIEDVKQWYHEFISDDDKHNLELSGKLVLLMDILRECETIGDKIILFSQSLLALDCIENMLEHCSSQPVNEEDKSRDAIATWTKGLDYFRMDGGTSVDFRKSYIDMFNDPSNERARLFLISTRAGSLGTNLVGANRVVILDTSWNPSHDVQAIFRAYRFGQTKSVYIYRLLAQGTMEEKIYDRQVTKLSLSCRVVDEQQIDRHFSAADLAELYRLDPNATSNRPTPMVPNDRLLAEMLIKNKDWIVTYHEHDSLLQNQTEEDLTEEECQAAWTKYEIEREGRKPETSNRRLTPEDMNELIKEPDFTSDYEGKLIPDVKVIEEYLSERFKSQTPGLVNTVAFKRLLLNGFYAVRQVIREKNVKVLRVKQEFCDRGPVPNSVNKYLDELSQALRSTEEYAVKLNKVIQSELFEQHRQKQQGHQERQQHKKQQQRQEMQQQQRQKQQQQHQEQQQQQHQEQQQQQQQKQQQQQHQEQEQQQQQQNDMNLQCDNLMRLNLQKNFKKIFGRISMNS